MKSSFFDTFSWALRRHPILYYVRYLLLSKNFKGKSFDKIGCFNDINEIKDVPKIYFDVNKQIDLNLEMDELEKAIKITAFLKKNIIGGPGLSLSSEKTLEMMLNGKYGVCSDFSQVFTVFCFINNIRVKEWACIDRFYKGKYGGHTFNEIYSSNLKKWIALDSSMELIFNNKNGDYLSVAELFEYLRNNNSLIYNYISIEKNRKDDVRLHLIYSKLSIPYIVTNYKNYTIDSYINKYVDKYPQFIINLILIIKKENYNFLFVMDNYKIKLLPQILQRLKLFSNKNNI